MGQSGSGGYSAGVQNDTMPCSFRAPRDKCVAAPSVSGWAIGSLIPLRIGALPAPWGPPYHDLLRGPLNQASGTCSRQASQASSSTVLGVINTQQPHGVQQASWVGVVLE